MASTTHPEFEANTEGIDVAKAFASGIRGNTVLVTGVNRGGIGYSTSQAFASQSPARLIIAGRNPSKVQASIDALKEEFPQVDYRALIVNLSVQASVRSAAAEVLAWDDVPTIDIVVNSAGVMCLPERTLTEDGIEMHFATNHIGHWLLTCLIMPKLIKAAEGKPQGSVRVVNVSSASPIISNMRWSDVNFDMKNLDLPKEEQPLYDVFKAWGYKNSEEASYIPLDGYNRSKVANVLFGIGANKRLFNKYGILSLAVHPGIMQTELARDMAAETLQVIADMKANGMIAFKTLGAGSSTSLVAALDPALAKGFGEAKDGKENWGSYLDNCQITNEAQPLAVSSSEAEKLWKLSEKLVKETFAW
ncbi:hypothetical protein G7046_g3812 [Stylonectria norvegica]|nr:hypothetical protein G7046_g3812 [Stylonectria norvegica]